MITYEDIKNSQDIKAYIAAADESLIELGFTEHSFAHVTKASTVAAEILTNLGYDAHTVELVRIAGHIHDIGNLVNRDDHAQSGAIMAFKILTDMGMPASDVAAIVSAIGNHDEGTAVPVSPMAAALILADKSDVRRSRVRNRDIHAFDIHDRVNWAVYRSDLTMNDEKTLITLSLDIDTEICSVMDYFEIFLGRMVLCRKAAVKLGLVFALVVNGQRLL